MFNYNNVKFRTNIADAFLVHLEQTKYILSTHPEQQYSTLLFLQVFPQSLRSTINVHCIYSCAQWGL